MKYKLTFLFLIFRVFGFAQNDSVYSSAANVLLHDSVRLKLLKEELSEIYDRDQKTRVGKDSTEFVSYIDSCNLIQVEAIIAKYRWLGKSVIGNKANLALFVVIQHSELPVQEKYFPLLEESVRIGESNASNMALLKDRILMRQGKKQIYGSQIILNNTGGQEFYPIEDEKNVNERRKTVGLEPIEEYAKYFGIDYKLSGQ